MRIKDTKPEKYVKGNVTTSFIFSKGLWLEKIYAIVCQTVGSFIRLLFTIQHKYIAMILYPPAH